MCSSSQQRRGSENREGVVLEVSGLASKTGPDLKMKPGIAGESQGNAGW